MKKQNLNNVENVSVVRTGFGKLITGFAAELLVLALVVLAGAIASNAQTGTVYGGLSNFDVVNHSGHDAHGFEIEIVGLPSGQAPYSFSYERYGAAKMIPTANGFKLRWESPYAGGAFTATTVDYAGSGQFGGTCYMGNSNYDAAGCEHFGVSLAANPTAQHYRWLIEDSANPGTLIAVDPPVALPAPIYFITPPVQTGEAPVLEANFEAPEPAERPDLYGDAQWVKVFKRELPREVTLDELMSDNPTVPQDAAEVEIAWEIVQTEPAAAASGQRGKKSNKGTLKFDTKAVVRRYESYNFTGTYDPVTHQAMCADTLCNTPADNELGEFIGAQMAAANLSTNSLTVSKTGNGTVNSSDRLIKCGVLCVAGYNRNAAVTLTAVPDKSSVFTGWTGACAGNALTCTVNVTDATQVSATFATNVTFSVKTSGGKGAVNGSFGINCGRICSASVSQGSAATVTAVPDAGFKFSSWTGGCIGSGATCNLTLNATTQLQANFVKQ
ncbi:hypothetical protein BH10ACI2_BH10ACI2_16320 [soil metagenome]